MSDKGTSSLAHKRNAIDENIPANNKALHYEITTMRKHIQYLQRKIQKQNKRSAACTPNCPNNLQAMNTKCKCM